MELSGQLTFASDLLLIPVSDLPDESRSRLDCEEDDFAVSRLHGRTGSKIVDAQAAGLLERFRTPRTIVDAVVLFSRERKLDPTEVLESAYPLLKGLLEGGFLVHADGDGAPEGAAKPGAPTWSAGTALAGGILERCLQVLDDTEVHVLVRDGARSVLKVERSAARSATASPVAERLRREGLLLAYLAGGAAPALLGQGEIEGRGYLELELVAGVDAAAAAAEWRERGGAAGRRGLLDLLCRVVETYAALHEHGVVHGDVHPRNVLVERGSRVRLIDFGVARATGPGRGLPHEAERGGVPFFFEPELAAAALAGRPGPPASEAGEQFALGALLYLLATGAHWRDFSLGRDDMLSEIAEENPLPFRERAVEPWPELEETLRRALAKRPEERFGSLRELARALGAISTEEVPTPEPTRAPTSAAPTAPLDRLLRAAIERASLEGPWWHSGLEPAPRVSVNYGAAGLSLGLLQIAQRQGEPGLLASADAWAQRAVREMGSEGAFYNAAIEITPEMVGESSIYHSPTGVHAVEALIARAMADEPAQASAVARFLKAAKQPAAGLDITLGRASGLLGAAILLDALPGSDKGDRHDPGALRAFGDATLTELWKELDAKPEVERAGIEYLGIAHGWAGFLYATLQWCAVSGTAIPSGVERRLDELAALAMPTGRGAAWPWVLRRGEAPMTMAGWCNGSCGYVFLWTLAHRLFGHDRYLDLAVGAGWDSWDGPETVVTLCCGAAGRAYALLNLYRHEGSAIWLERARDLARRAARAERSSDEYLHSLYKGGFGLAVLAADLEQPEDAAMPLFEPVGYRYP